MGNDPRFDMTEEQQELMGKYTVRGNSGLIDMCR